MTDASHWEAMGGRPFFETLVHLFYVGIADDELLRPMYPESDLGPAENRLRMFLEQYWGGPSDYHEQRGHPRLRIRHAEFAVTREAADRWLFHMLGALDRVNADPALALSPEYDQALRDYLTRAAEFPDQHLRRAAGTHAAPSCLSVATHPDDPSATLETRVAARLRTMACVRSNPHHHDERSTHGSVRQA